MVYILTLLYFIFFVVFYLKNRTRVMNGLLFIILLLLCGISLIMLTDQTQSRWLFYLVVVLSAFILILNVFSSVIIILTTFVSSFHLIKKEGFRLSNGLSLGSGIVFILWIVANAWISITELSPMAYYILLSINAIIVYFIVIFTSFLVSSLIYQVYTPLRHQHYIIVLGSGLLNGETVTPLLASRIDRAIQVFHKQKKNPPYLILSGGQGKDEKVSESYAMKQYALNCGIDEQYLIMESNSKNTYENLLFSKQIIEEREKDIQHCRILFSTTNYHVYRAGIYANQVQLKANGIGASTKFYFWLNALLREFVAILAMNKKIYGFGLVIVVFMVLVVGAIFKETDTLIAVIKSIQGFMR